MKKRAIIAWAVAALGCSSHDDIEQTVRSEALRNGFEIREIVRGGTGHVYRVEKIEKSTRWLVSELETRNGIVSETVPTPLKWGCTGQASGFSTRSNMLVVTAGAIGHGLNLVEVRVLTNAMVTFNGIDVPEDEFASFLQKICVPHTLVYIAVDRGARISSVDKLLKIILTSDGTEGVIIREYDGAKAPWRG